MELKPHDLLKIKKAEDLISYTPVPEWVEAALAKTPFVVVRRTRAAQGLVAVGVRGSVRSERFGAFLPVDLIVNRISPEQLAEEKGWKNRSKEIFRSVEQISHLMECASLQWGPVGSLGFELASGNETVTEKSDIDIVIRFSRKLTLDAAKKIDDTLKKNLFRIDAQVDTAEGAFSLSEYALSEEKEILVRTIDGPLLKKIKNHPLLYSQ
ncbi:malonate decarboxylase holo-ACP synthase [Domibacillus sp. PGB-M46]|uniref:malonate decarboxylase holo-ACP synthase n=1 Tax=Domibacillus sp. PGB-M46 TaxID=2910255 RepID=UPI001F58262A|nr:malonate decarboxylase holo-ACP synthase [Domibacillus sp. PGB-M46]MCI2257047.1 malonate decarboxylase holo-ACP synthase [Domibacillus sp. PGB-M46]